MENGKKLLAEGQTGFIIEWCQRCKAPSARLIKTFRGGEWIAKPLTTRALTGREKFQFPLPLLASLSPSQKLIKISVQKAKNPTRASQSS
jgi:hypothetical protein